MKVANRTRFFSVLKQLCKSDFGMIPKSCVVEAFDRVSFDLSQVRLIDANQLKHEVETCCPTTIKDFQKLIDKQPTITI